LESQEMIDDHVNLKTIEVISNHIKEGDYTLIDEYYMVNSKKGTDTIRVTNKGLYNHKYGYAADTREMYVAFFGQKSLTNQWMVSALYSKLSYGWKLVELDINPYTQNGKIATELYDDAKKKFLKGYVVDAINQLAMAKNCMHPALGWVYPDEAKMTTFYFGLINEANDKYKFPLIVRQAPTQPHIFRILTESNPQGVFPMIYYQSKIKLSDINGLKKENAAVRKAIGNVIPGIDKDKKYVFYTAFNKLPNSSESVDRYEMIDTLK
jgi:hypothetical protein